MHLKLRHLEVFHALMEAGSVSEAAERLNLSQPAVSVALSNLEQELGFVLFHRSRGFFSPTNEAQLLHAETERSLLSIDRVRGRADQIRAGAIGTVNIASNGAVAVNLLPWIISSFRDHHPDVTVDLKIWGSRQIASWVSGRLTDFGLIDAPVPVAGLEAEIFELPCVCIFQAGDDLEKLQKIRPGDLAVRPLVAVTGDHAVDRQVDRAFSEAGIVLERRVAGSFFAIARNLVRAGAGVAIVDCINGTADLGDGVVWRPFEPAVTYELALVRARNNVLSIPSERMLSMVRDRLAAAVKSGQADPDPERGQTA